MTIIESHRLIENYFSAQEENADFAEWDPEPSCYDVIFFPRHQGTK